MKYSLFDQRQLAAVAQMFNETFTASESEEEGALIARLTLELAALSEGPDVFGHVALDHDRIAGAIFMSRLRTGDEDDLFLLSPLGVHPEYQRQGVGRALILAGFDSLRKMDIAVCVSYGDPDYYAASGFDSVSEDVIPAPHALSMPFGWIAASMDGNEVRPVSSPTQCVAPFDDPSLW